MAEEGSQTGGSPDHPSPPGKDGTLVRDTFSSIINPGSLDATLTGQPPECTSETVPGNNYLQLVSKRGKNPVGNSA